MKNNEIQLIIVLFFSLSTTAQKFEIGDKINPRPSIFKHLDYAPSMRVHTYQYVGKLTDKYLFDRRVGEILVGVKNGVIVTLIYNLIPDNGEHKIPQTTLKLIKNKWNVALRPIPHDKYVMTTGNKLVSLELINNEMTFDQARLVYYTTIKYSILMP